ncbi:hypothetical protein [Nocardia otitidiscaviarum]|uniref:hypothetical protein n=1 Tax=Nocardia otitidiscaviarum TaxID=1823 RepID=UPI001892DE68|nr:hypothetical protein [Nocardia otitidiscaviarum]MBF6177344.1 hypothetical protein [Nocardia otitidiscaviarum]
MSDQSFRDGPAQYAIGQLARAAAAAARAAEGVDRDRARERMRRWRDVLDGMADGSLRVGDRTPVSGLPAWVTLEVAHGGFATGRALAEQPLGAAESALLTRLPGDVPGGTDRERLNRWYLGDAGQADLLAALRSGQYRIEVPEDAALPVVALLLERGFAAEALDLVAELSPLLDRLRFVPPFDPAARPAGTAVRVASVGEVRGALRAVRTPEPLTAMRTTLEVWNPLYDRLVALWCETVTGELPTLDETGAVRGGWPCRRLPADWAAERDRWLADVAVAQRDYGLSGRHAQPRGNFARLHDALLSCPDGSANLTARQVGWIRRAIANTVTRHGAPGSAARARVRAAQRDSIAAPLHTTFAALLTARLRHYPAEGGIPDLAPVSAPVSDDDRCDIPSGTAIPRHLLDKAARALEASADELIRRGIIGSGDMLARVLPQLTSRLLAADFADPAAANLYEQLYTAFRRRRGLLLLNLQGQVRFEELPWVAAMAALRGGGADAAGIEDAASGVGDFGAIGADTAATEPAASRRARHRGDAARHGALAARRLLGQMTLLTLDAFPYALLPNPLVREFGALARQAELDLPLVEEVAADIFMGTFTTKWLAAALVAGRTLEGTLYQAYYDLPAPGEWGGHADTTQRWGRATAAGFTELCTRRAGEAGCDGGYVARNGAILEQSQILTTHNLAVLVDTLELTARVRDSAPDLARDTFTWVVRQLSRPAPNRHAELITVKNAAYAWRQGVYLLAACDRETQRAQVLRLIDDAGDTPLAPAITGLGHIVEGGRFTRQGWVPDGSGRRLLGWTARRHWLFGGP